MGHIAVMRVIDGSNGTHIGQPWAMGIQKGSWTMGIADPGDSGPEPLFGLAIGQNYG